MIYWSRLCKTLLVLSVMYPMVSLAAGDGAGVITNNYGINCRSDGIDGSKHATGICKFNAPANALIVYTAKAERGSVFDGWSADLKPCGIQPTCYARSYNGKLATFDATFSNARNPKVIGDIVAQPWALIGGAVGHVGIWTGNKVLEVVNADKKKSESVIQQNDLHTFKRRENPKKDAYWGASYGKGSNHYQVIAAGWAQKDL